MSENQAGVYDWLENVNGRVKKLTNEIQGAFGRFYQMIMLSATFLNNWITGKGKKRECLFPPQFGRNFSNGLMGRREFSSFLNSQYFSTKHLAPMFTT
jgi:hypothetical protein